jgi:S1-C subfamily serine protease
MLSPTKSVRYVDLPMTHVRFLALILVTMLLGACEQASDLIPGESTRNPVVVEAEATPILVTPSVSVVTETATPTPSIKDHELARSVVQIHIVDTRSLIRTIRDGSGVIIDSDDGLILTAYSLVYPYATSGARAYSTITIGVNDGNGGVPLLAYEAVLVAANATTDLAVLRISREYQGDPLGSGEIDLVSAEFGDSSIVEPGDRVRLFAHRGQDVESAESQSLGVTNGTVTGRRGQFSQTNASRFKLDARLEYGATGGPAFDASGALIGIMVPEHYSHDSLVSQLRPFQLSEQLIATARLFPSSEAYIPPLLATEPPAGFDSPPAADRSWISRPAFAESATNLGKQIDLLDYERGFLSETQKLYFEFVVRGLAKDVPVEERWYMNDVLQDSLSSSYLWTGNEFTIVADQISVPATTGLPDGLWRLEVWADEILRASSTAVIGVNPERPAIANVEFGILSAANGRKLADAAAGADQLLMFFDYTGMELSRSINWVVLHDDSLQYQSNEIPWTAGSAGHFWVGYTGADPIEPGTWRFELFIDGELNAESEIVLT